VYAELRPIRFTNPGCIDGARCLVPAKGIRHAEVYHPTMCDKNPDVSLPEDEQDLIDQLEDERGREITEEEANLAVTQARLIGDL